ncbi:hypothetical protein DL767_001092 [Monosporascus sp. MG133]|nr:hypothetical protein DL767_001092 [Monosporascus sp. MG133]
MIGRDFAGSYCRVPVDSDGALGHGLMGYGPMPSLPELFVETEDDLVMIPRTGFCTLVSRTGSDASTRHNVTILAPHSAPPIAHIRAESLVVGFDLDCQSRLGIVFNWCIDAIDTDKEFAESTCNGDGFDGTLQCKTICSSKDLDLGQIRVGDRCVMMLYCTTQLKCSNVEKDMAPDMYKKYDTAGNSGFRVTIYFLSFGYLADVEKTGPKVMVLRRQQTMKSILGDTKRGRV